jgi:hypothetical protein
MDPFKPSDTIDLLNLPPNYKSRDPFRGKGNSRGNSRGYSRGYARGYSRGYYRPRTSTTIVAPVPMGGPVIVSPQPVDTYTVSPIFGFTIVLFLCCIFSLFVAIIITLGRSQEKFNNVDDDNMNNYM